MFSRMRLAAATLVMWPLIAAGAAHAEPSSAAAQAVSAWAVKRTQANAESMGREKNAVTRLVKFGTGISTVDIGKHGWRGGKNSVIRKPFGKLGRHW